MQNMGLGERLLYAVPHSLKNMAVVGTTGVLAGMGASSAARSIATVAPLSSSSTVSRGIGQINATRQQAAMEYETSTALQEGNQAVSDTVFKAATTPSLDPGVVYAQSHALNVWYSRQTELSPPQFLSQARQSHVINHQQYHALLRDHSAQAEFAENYKRQLGTMAERDSRATSPAKVWVRLANLKDILRDDRITKIWLSSIPGRARLGKSLNVDIQFLFKSTNLSALPSTPQAILPRLSNSPSPHGEF
jgi:hypothetical protein